MVMDAGADAADLPKSACGSVRALLAACTCAVLLPRSYA